MSHRPSFGTKLLGGESNVTFVQNKDYNLRQIRFGMYETDHLHKCVNKYLRHCRNSFVEQYLLTFLDSSEHSDGIYTLSSSKCMFNYICLTDTRV